MRKGWGWCLLELQRKQGQVDQARGHQRKRGQVDQARGAGQRQWGMVEQTGGKCDFDVSPAKYSCG
jgi:hypothetical protein